LIPAGSVIRGADGRGPYIVENAEQIARDSMSFGMGRLPIDEAHATDLAAPKGEPSPARGWIVALQARASGIWGKVEWTEGGKRLLADKAYRFMSPVIRHLQNGRVMMILRAALVNTPNFRELTALHSESRPSDLAALSPIPMVDLKGVQTALNSQQLAILTALGVSPEAYARTLADDRN
jgi:phage I-like protein